MNYDHPIYLENIDEFFESKQDIDKLIDKQLEWYSLYDISNFNDRSASINLEIWRTPDHQQMFPSTVIEANSLIENDIARYGLYIPKDLKPSAKFSYNNFITSDGSYKRTEILFRLAEESVFLENIKKEARIHIPSKNINHGLYVPDHCISDSEPCATVFTSHYYDTKFFIQHIETLKLKMKVYFLGDNLKPSIRKLVNIIKASKNLSSSKKIDKLFLVLHWTPSEIIDGNDQFDEVTMPRCELYRNANISCKFEANSIAVFFNEIISKESEDLKGILSNFKFDSLKPLIKLYEKEYLNIEKIRNMNLLSTDLKGSTNEDTTIDDILNRIACTWLGENKQVYGSSPEHRWYNPVADTEIQIGGIYPVQNSGQEYNGIQTALDMAREELEENPEIKKLFPNYSIKIMSIASECKPDLVLRKFISFYSHRQNLIGVLGPACSEAIEPIAAISKHYKLSAITYSAEGISFENRDNFPYFYRTIGENRQYEDVYFKLFKKLGWQRAAAITEDGQKYTEYITRMEHNDTIKILSNKKFPRENDERKQAERFEKDLKDLRDNYHARIIISDIHDHTIMKTLMCTASKLKMTLQHGFVWFLPVYVTLKMNESSVMDNNISCTANELREALNGHFSMSYAAFGNDFDILPTNMTVKNWTDEYKMKRKIQTLSPSDYAPYVYDAIWVYAKAIMQLIKEDEMGKNATKYWYMKNLDKDQTMLRLEQILNETSFQGVSGKIEFNSAGSRYTNVSVLQWQKNNFEVVGMYRPKIIDKSSNDGDFEWFEKIVQWGSDEVPDDGKETCALMFLANAFNIECSTINTSIIVILCILIVFACSGFSFLFWKHKYAKKLEESAQIMMNYGRVVNGIELSKWEIPRENVIINRRIGEGAFGTVYGGEALINEDDGWRPVAIKTLKAGSTPENRLDFLAESEIMKRFDHKNIVKLLAVCLQKEPLCSVMEFMLYGDLKTYLLSRRHLVDDRANEDTNDISPKRLTLMALDVSRGLSYLASLNFVHRDIACRNCLINAQRIIKIGDFGMARSTCENDYYRFTRKGMLPIRWMSPESIDGGMFSHASDVWSFGVFLYEVVTLGGFPYQGLNNNQVFELVKSGESIKIPAQSKPPLKALMSSCFNIDPKKRPGASTIVEFITNYPRMLTPCMSDIPKPNLDEQVNLIDSDINEDFDFDPLIENRERSHTPAVTIDFLRPSASSSALQNQTRNHEFDYLDMKLPKRLNGIYNFTPDLTSTLPNGNYYNPIQPLLNSPRSTEISKSTLSLMKYVPMCFNKNKNRSSPEECTSAL
ncbi:hypothetical protein ACKWTF_001105 [Chironomus riparius]